MSLVIRSTTPPSLQFNPSTPDFKVLIIDRSQAIPPPSPAFSESSPQKRNAGKKLLALGHDGLSDFTSRDFKMHEFLR